MKKLEATIEAKSLDDISEDWKIIARRGWRAMGNEMRAIWDYTGSLSDSTENVSFRKLAFGYGRGETPHISCVTGRDANGTLCLYARIYPIVLRNRRSRLVFA